MINNCSGHDSNLTNDSFYCWINLIYKKMHILEENTDCLEKDE